MSKQFEGKVALGTDTASGIGRVSALAFGLAVQITRGDDLDQVSDLGGFT